MVDGGLEGTLSWVHVMGITLITYCLSFLMRFHFWCDGSNGSSPGDPRWMALCLEICSYLVDERSRMNHRPLHHTARNGYNTKCMLLMKISAHTWPSNSKVTVLTRSVKWQKVCCMLWDGSPWSQRRTTCQVVPRTMWTLEDTDSKISSFRSLKIKRWLRYELSWN